MKGNSNAKKTPDLASTNRAATIQEQLRNRRANRGHVDDADWSAADPNRIARCVVAGTRAGLNVQFGKTSNGGAFTVCLYDYVTKSQPDVIRPTEDIDLYLEGLALDIEDLTGKPT